jgi:hypothetical protein
MPLSPHTSLACLGETGCQASVHGLLPWQVPRLLEKRLPRTPNEVAIAATQTRALVDWKYRPIENASQQMMHSASRVVKGDSSPPRFYSLQL